MGGVSVLAAEGFACTRHICFPKALLCRRNEHQKAKLQIEIEKGDHMKINKHVTTWLQSWGFSPLALGTAVTLLCAFAQNQTFGQATYRQINLVSDQPGAALVQDTNLVNAWGMASSST